MAGDDASRSAPLTGASKDARAFVPGLPLLDALEATRVDGTPRHVIVGDAPDHEIDLEICRDAEGHLVVRLPNPDPIDENEALRQLARQMAAETDTSKLLEILCTAAGEQCAANGASVLKAVANEGELIAATGPLSVARGRRFALPGSLAREVLRTRDVVAVADFSGSGRPLMKVAPEVRVGPMLLAPLIAHETILGVLAATRDIGAPPFSKREAHRMRAIADYAALALWKAELLDQAQSADRAKSRFLATVSHELRTPLTALAGYEELLVDQVMGPLSDSQLDVLERMRSVTQHLASVIEEVLAFSSLDEGHETVRPTDFLAADLVHAAMAIVEPMARQKRLAFGSVVPDAPIRMNSDIDKIRQILVNLVGNAVKFTDAGEIKLELERRGTEIRFTVRDTGIGIAKRDLDRLFKPFAQLDTGLTRRHGGTGLGLYIAKGLAELLGGRIEVASDFGKGSAFTLVLPADEA
ncbi:MAG TPA: HAMP domain-containing sensor histidine kinase [Gemmatimonadaceae bacterium]|nr:HAMP domain-containing sensor histidine kinase [Gemmatimonadaceae bacterium]